MKRTIIALALAAAFTTSAYATNNNNGPTNNCNGNGSCASNTTVNANGGNGGNASATANGGQGGAGGSANVGNGIGNFSPKAEANQSQGQGQLQGQKQGQEQGQGQGQSQSTRNSNNAKQSTNVTVEGDKVPRQAVPGIAPSVGTTAVCMVGISGGVGTTIGGISFGTSVRDEICSKLDAGKAAIQLGMHLGDDEMVAEGRALVMDAVRQLKGKGEVRPTAAAADASSLN